MNKNKIIIEEELYYYFYDSKKDCTYIFDCAHDCIGKIGGKKTKKDIIMYVKGYNNGFIIGKIIGKAEIHAENKFCDKGG